MADSRSLKRRVKDFLKFKVLRMLLTGGQRVGLSILPRHYYSEIPHIRSLRRSPTWRNPSKFTAIRGAELGDQITAAKNLFAPIPNLSAVEEQEVHGGACRLEGAIGYGSVDAAALFRWVHSVRPPAIVQVGSGVSTAVILNWLDRTGSKCTVTCIEPYPSKYLQQQAAAGRIQLRTEPAQATPFTVFQDIPANGLLFIDSTHTTIPGSEVNRLILEVLPALASKVWVHFHDIWFPYHFRSDILTRDLFFWRETILLQAFLTGNQDYSLKTSLSMLHHQSPETLQELISWYRPRKCLMGIEEQHEGDLPTSCYLLRS